MPMSLRAPLPSLGKATTKVLRAPKHSPLSPQELEPAEKLTRIRAGEDRDRGWPGPGDRDGGWASWGHSWQHRTSLCPGSGPEVQNQVPQADSPCGWRDCPARPLSLREVATTSHGCGNVTPFRIRVL